MNITVFIATISILLDCLRCYIKKRNKVQNFLAGSSLVNQKQIAGKNSKPERSRTVLEDLDLMWRADDNLHSPTEKLFESCLCTPMTNAGSYTKKISPYIILYQSLL